MSVSDLEFADFVRAAAGWNQTLADWRRFLRFEPDGCFVAELDGQPAGTATTICYGDVLGWIGMILVHPDFRRRGVATALMEHAIEHLSARVKCIKLDATPAGRPVYERLGFEAEYELYRWKRDSSAASLTCSKESGVIGDFDAAAFGANRENWISALMENAKAIRVGGCALGLIRSGMIADYLGPITAVDVESGRTQTRDLVQRLDRQTFWDIPEPNQAAIEIAEEFGFERDRPLLRMRLGPQLEEGDPTLQFAIGDPATG